MLGRKFSDEFPVPLCRKHHMELHRQGNESAWWANHQIPPLDIAADLIRRFSPIHSGRSMLHAASLNE